uniref:Plastid-encoded RNA polymerase subunit alpha n=1 Tax=Haematococcus lacustris TaxID=44745 RepID=A0A2K9YRK4_HAELA|nr:DNA-directed RNA polymerase subunit alpha [Haematococcus lacustris]AUW36433.1 DNA-directed RNA polymerase subunit alpha [Haematococcus lacustris]
MTIVSCKESRIESPRSFYACFSLGPFEESMSLTVANALRRTLLTECTGIAIVNVLFENVNHEYATLVGVRETVLDILLNIKEIVLKKQTNPISQLLNPKTHIPSSTFPFSRKEGCFAEGSGALKSPRAGIEPSGIEGAPNSAAPARPIPKPFRLGGSYAWGSSLVFPLKTKYSQTILSFKGLGAPSPNLGLGAPEKNQGRAPSPKLGLGAPNPLSLGQTKGTARRPEPLRRGSAQISVLPLVGRGLVGRPRPTRGRPTSPWSVQGSPVFPIGTGALCPPGLPRRPALCQSGLPIGAGALGHPSQGKDQAKEECADRRHLRCFTDREARKGKGNKTIKGQTKKILGKAKTTLYNKVYSFFPVVAYLRMKGPGIIRAKHLRLPPFVQCVDPEQYITTLSEDGILNMKCIIMEGKGYIIQKSKTNKNYLLGSSHSKAAGG